MLKKGQLPILIIIIITLIFFTLRFISQKNYEFIFYVGVIIFFLILILLTNKKVSYPNTVLWGLAVWAFLHMSGGGLYPNGTRLYSIILIPITETVFRYDQLVHTVGFGVATLVTYVLLKPFLNPKLNKGIGLSIVIVMAGLGVGALNEIIEFLATVLVPQTGVGGYLNTSLDLVADLVGALLALIFIRIRKGNI